MPTFAMEAVADRFPVQEDVPYPSQFCYRPINLCYLKPQFVRARTFKFKLPGEILSLTMLLTCLERNSVTVTLELHEFSFYFVTFYHL
jgi:hypothetical protein